uniref:MH2 domain-containing protein n=1 Tax=Glossina pallidipes TaxID=7398 RepID=A0A1A9ZUW6_GLOPL
MPCIISSSPSTLTAWISSSSYKQRIADCTKVQFLFCGTIEHIQEVLDKWTQIDDEIWAKVIVFERNRRVAKAYARAPVLTINGRDFRAELRANPIGPFYEGSLYNNSTLKEGDLNPSIAVFLTSVQFRDDLVTSAVTESTLTGLSTSDIYFYRFLFNSVLV